MSKAELARAANSTDQNIGQLESGVNKGNVNPDTLFALADALGVHARWLALGTGPRKRGDHVDADRMELVIRDVWAAIDRLGLAMTIDHRARVAVRLYDVWCKTGGLPDIELALRLYAGLLEDDAEPKRPRGQ